VTTPVPPGRGQWRVSVHRRSWQPEALTSSIVAYIDDARGRSLTQTLNASAQFTFTVDGRSPTAQLVTELQSDVVAWRWDEVHGVDVPYFRGVVAQGEDQLTEDDHTTTFYCHDYLGVLARRYLTAAQTFAQIDQDQIVANLLSFATNNQSASDGTLFRPGSFLPLQLFFANADGTLRGALSGELRDRTYTAQSGVGPLIDDLSKVISMRDPTRTAFDYDVRPAAWSSANQSQGDVLRVFYPGQGVVNPVVLEYGSTISTVTRSANSTDYANYVRVVGSPAPGSAAGAPPMFSEKWNGDANNVTVVPVGLWMNTDNASDVTLQPTLDQKAAGDLHLSGVLVPSYQIGLRPGTFRHGLFNMGDTVGLVIQSGRLNVFSDPAGGEGLRVVGMTFGIGEDGDETVGVTVGRPLTTLSNMLRAGLSDVDALARR
jgi:hypothetical protein